jgi:hypothetical protein
VSAKLVSDGTAAGTTLEVDGKPLLGVTFVGWELPSGGTKRATVRLEIRDIEVEIHQPGRDRPVTS